jgi:hypothetical protein
MFHKLNKKKRGNSKKGDSSEDCLTILFQIQASYTIEWNKIIMNVEFPRFWKDVVVTYLEAWTLNGREEFEEDNKKKIQPG